MKRLFMQLLTWAALAAPALPVLAADPLDGVVPLVKDDLAAVAQLKERPDAHVLLFFGDQLN
jgi:hypothetical protein